MKRVWFCGALASALLTLPLAVDAQQTAKIWRIGWLGLDSSMQATRIVALESGLRDLGYVEGKNISIERRWAEGRFDRLPELANELVAAHVDVIVTASPPGVRAAQRATSTIPIVMLVHEPVRMGFVQSLAKPGGNITGIAFQDTELSEKRLDLFRHALPKLSKLAILWNGAEGTDPKGLQSIEDTAKAMGLQVLSVEVREPKDFAQAIAAAKSWGAQGLVEMAPGDLAVEQPRDFEFVINLKAAQDLGLTVPPTLLLQATDVVR